MKIKLHAPTQQYGFVEIEEELDITEMPRLRELESIYNRYSETPVSFDIAFKKVKTYTGEFVLYDAINHRYTDTQGNELISGSQYAKQFGKPFDKANILPKFADKHGVDPQEIDDYWRDNADMSAGFGTAIHKLMENWYRHGQKSYYNPPKHPLLAEILDTFPEKEKEGKPELFVSAVELKRVGQIDLLLNKEIVDYKITSEENLKKDLEKYGHQLNFYRSILEHHKQKIDKMTIWNWTGTKKGWVKHKIEVINNLKSN